MIHIGLEDKNRKEVSRLLNVLLADEFVLSTRTKNYHWNVTGPHFQELHSLFGDQSRKLDELVDRIAERIRALGGTPVGSLIGFLKNTRFSEHPRAHLSASAMVEGLLDDHELLIRDLREDLGANPALRLDAGTTDFLTSILLEHEASAWILRSFRGEEVKLRNWLHDQSQIPHRRELPSEVALSAAAGGEST